MIRICFIMGMLFVIDTFSSLGATDAKFTYNLPGDLEPKSGSGVTDDEIYYPSLRFPLEGGPAFLNSQVYRPGGSEGGPGGQCSISNYSYPWRDNFCEVRRWSVPICPGGKGHQGQDIRPATCKAGVHWAVAALDGVVTNIGRYSVTIQTASGTILRYLHLQRSDLAVRELDYVRKGDRIGKVSNEFGGTPTTIHLHFDIKDTILVRNQPRAMYIPPYSSLVASYKRLIGE